MFKKWKKVMVLLTVIALVLSATPVFAATPVLAVDTASPFIVSTSPCDEYVSVSTDAEIRIWFSEEININDEEGIALSDSQGNNLISSKYSSDNCLVIVPEKNLLPECTYIVNIAEEAIADNFGNSAAQYSMNFGTSKDYVAPKIQNIAPDGEIYGGDMYNGDGSLVVLKNQGIVFEYSENVSLKEQLVDVTDINDQYIGFSIISNPTGFLIVPNPAEVNVGDTYFISVANEAVTDMAGKKAWEAQTPFTIVKDTIPPEFNITIYSDGSAYIDAYDDYKVAEIQYTLNGVTEAVKNTDFCSIQFPEGGINKLQVKVTDTSGNENGGVYTIQ